jgi:hypothetical protein
MRVELLADTGEPPELLRFCGYTPAEFEQLCDWFEDLARSGPGRSILLAPRAGIDLSGVSGLEAAVSERDEGFIRGEPARWTLSAESWREVLERAQALDAFESRPYQWLTRTGATPVLLSLTGQW